MINIPHYEDLKLPMSYKELSNPPYMAEFFEYQYPELENMLKPDIIRFINEMKPNSVRLAKTDYSLLIEFTIPISNPIHIMGTRWYFKVYLDSSYGDENTSWGDISVISDFEWAAYYMNAPFEDCIQVVDHIMDAHARAFREHIRSYLEHIKHNS